MFNISKTTYFGVICGLFLAFSLTSCDLSTPSPHQGNNAVVPSSNLKPVSFSALPNWENDSYVPQTGEDLSYNGIIRNRSLIGIPNCVFLGELFLIPPE